MVLKCEATTRQLLTGRLTEKAVVLKEDVVTVSHRLVIKLWHFKNGT